MPTEKCGMCTSRKLHEQIASWRQRGFDAHSADFEPLKELLSFHVMLVYEACRKYAVASASTDHEVDLGAESSDDDEEHPEINLGEDQEAQGTLDTTELPPEPEPPDIKASVKAPTPEGLAPGNVAKTLESRADSPLLHRAKSGIICPPSSP
ncbi:UNVERIFIED_CONTAM: hypothetical protein K2H54_069698 [Gekko kuhli]